MNQICLSGYLLCKCFFSESAWIFLFLLTMCLVSMNHRFHLLNYYLLTKECTEIHIHHQTSKEWLKIKKICPFIHLTSLSIWNHWTSSKSIKQFPCVVITGNRGIWFGTIFPYKVNGGKWRCTFWCHISLYGNGRN